MIENLLSTACKRAALPLIAAGLVLINPSAHGYAVDLGQAGGYGAFIIPGGSSINLNIKGGAAVNGDVAAAGGMHIDLGSGAKVGITAGTDQVVSGKIYLDPNGATVKLDGQDPNSVVLRQLDQAVADAIAANQFAAGLTATQNLGALDITSPFSIVGNGGLNVISLTDVKLHGSGVLTIVGSATDKFVFNITSGSYNQSSKSTVVLSGGVTAENILWNFVGGGGGANVHSSGEAFGIFLSPDRSFNMDDTVLFGGIIAQGDLHIGSKALVISVIPEVSSFLPLVGLFAAVASARYLRRRKMSAKA